MKIAAWNVNSVRARLERVLEWLARHRPDVLCLQELKSTEADFPRRAFEAAGYHAVVWGQRTYNGVAILSREQARHVRRGLGDEGFDREARLLVAEVGGVTVASIYVPNGQVVGSEKHAYKLAWLGRLRQALAEELEPEAPLVLGGDFNVARDDLDVAEPEKWRPSVLCDPGTRSCLDALLQWGLVDLVREAHPEGGVYSWWDYRRLAFPRNDGLRIDYLLASRPLAARCTAAVIDREARKGKKPSDHAPVIADFT